MGSTKLGLGDELRERERGEERRQKRKKEGREGEGEKHIGYAEESQDHQAIREGKCDLHPRSSLPGGSHS
jgi:hypothetical protein